MIEIKEVLKLEQYDCIVICNHCHIAFPANPPYRNGKCPLCKQEYHWERKETAKYHGCSITYPGCSGQYHGYFSGGTVWDNDIHRKLV